MQGVEHLSRRASLGRQVNPIEAGRDPFLSGAITSWDRQGGPHGPTPPINKRDHRDPDLQLPQTRGYGSRVSCWECAVMLCYDVLRCWGGCTSGAWAANPG